MRWTKATVLAAAFTIAAAGLFSGVASADPANPDPAPGPAPAAPGPSGPAPAQPAAAAPGTTMDHDGIFIVGTDIQPGTYASAGPAETGTCYWKRMSDLHGGNIIDNALSKKPQIVSIDGTDKAFKTNGCQPWQLTDAAPPPQPAGGGLGALLAKAKLRGWMDTVNNNARQYDGSQVPTG